MSRGPAKFKQADVVRALKAARAAGFAVGQIALWPDGSIVLVDKPEATSQPTNAFDQWKAKRDAHSS